MTPQRPSNALMIPRRGYGLTKNVTMPTVAAVSASRREEEGATAASLPRAKTVTAMNDVTPTPVPTYVGTGSGFPSTLLGTPSRDLERESKGRPPKGCRNNECREATA